MFYSIGICTQGLALQCSVTWAMLPAFLLLVYFLDRVSCFCSGWPWTSTSCIAEITGVLYQPFFFFWDRVSPTFCPCWPVTTIFPSSPLVCSWDYKGESPCLDSFISSHDPAHCYAYSPKDGVFLLGRCSTTWATPPVGMVFFFVACM
jgi:hypothetical protein